MVGNCPIQTNCTCFNGDISGPGVRVSFYVQSVSLVLLTTRTAKLSEVADALTTLIVTNLAYCGITFYQGFGLKDDTGRLSFYDALMVVYCLCISTPCICYISLKYVCFKRRHRGIIVLVIVQFCVVLGLIMAIFVSASTWPCHEEWIFGIVFAAFLITGWPTLFLAHSARLATGATRFSVLNPLLDAIGSDTVGDLLNFFLEPTKETIWQAVLTIFGYAALAVANTELLRHLNDVPDTGAWGFGQLLAIALAGQPAWRAMTTFWELGFRQRPDVTPTEDELRLGFRTISRRRPPRSLARRFSQSQALSSHQTLRLLVIRVLEFVDILNLDSSGVMDDHARSAASSAANTELPRHINGVSETSAWGFGRLFTVALAGLDTRLRWRLPSLAVRFSQSHALSTNPPLRSLVIRWHTLVDTLFSREDRPPLVLTFGVPASVGEDPYIDSLEAAEHHARVEVAPVVEFEGRTHGAALSEGELALTGEGPGARPSEASADITSISASPDPIRTTVRTSPRDTPTLPERAHTEVREPNGGRCVARGGIRALEVDCTGESFALHSMEDV